LVVAPAGVCLVSLWGPHLGPLTPPAVKERFWLRKQRSPLTAPTVKQRFWLRKQPPRTCCVNCGRINVLKSTRPEWGAAGVNQGVRTAQPAVFDHIVFRERERRERERERERELY